MKDFDKSNMLDVLLGFPDMVKNAMDLGDDVTTPKELVHDIAVIGMGGSGFTGDLLKVYLSDTPTIITVIKDYTLPKFIGRKSLVFAISYSGNTEETISAYRSAIRRGCKVISISSGGKLEELAKMNKNPHILVPKGIQPRLSTPYLFFAILNVLDMSGMIPDQEKLIKKCAQNLEKAKSTIQQGAKDLALKVRGRVPVIYSSQKIYALAEKWKTDINENAKTSAFYNTFSEFNHNEICSYQNPMADLHIIILSDSEDHERIRNRIKVFKDTIKKYNVPITELHITGDNTLTRLLSTIWLGTFFAYYLALEYETDPTPVEIIEKFKKKL